jgi:hypothetical protein
MGREQRDEMAGFGAFLTIIFAIILFPIVLLAAALNTQAVYQPATAGSRRHPSPFVFQLINLVSLVVAIGGIAAFVFAYQQFTGWNGNRALSGIALMVGAAALLLAVLIQGEKRDQAHALIAQELATLPTARIYTIFPPMRETGSWGHEQLIEALLAISPTLTFAVLATGQAIIWQVIDPEGSAEAQTIRDTITSYTGGQVQIEVTEGTVFDEKRLPFYRDHLVFRLTNEFAAPLQTIDELTEFDPLRTIVERMNLLETRHDERVSYQLFVLAAAPTAARIGARRLAQKNVRPLGGIIRDGRSAKSGFDEKLVNAKLASNLYHAFFVVTIESKAAERLHALRQLAAQIVQFGLPGHNALKLYTGLPMEKLLPGYRVETEADFRETSAYELLHAWERLSRRWRDHLLVLSPAEIAALWHLPDETFTAGKIVWAGTGAPEEFITPSPGALLIGTTANPGRKFPVYLPQGERPYHHFTIGGTGAGKSTFLQNLILQDIAAGRGVAVIDPHGELIQQKIVPFLSERYEDVYLLECSKVDYPVPINPLRVPEGVDYAVVRQNILNAFESIYPSAQFAGVEHTLKTVLNALLCDPDAILLDVARIFTDATFRGQLIELVKNHPHRTAQTLQDLVSYGTTQKGELERQAKPIINRISALTASSTLELITCHPNTLNFIDLMRQNSVILIDLSGAEIGEEAGALAAVLLSSFFTASLALGPIQEGEPPRYYLYIDEAQRVMNKTLFAMLSEVRKFGLSLTLATQTLNQVPKNLLSNFLTNIGNRFVFQVGSDDASEVKDVFDPEVTKSDLQKMRKYHIGVKTRGHPAFIAKTPEPPKMVSGGRIDAIRAHTRETLQLLPQAAVRELIEARLGAGGTGATSQPTQPKPRRPKNNQDDLGEYE